jgi:hypothetical protein
MRLWQKAAQYRLTLTGFEPRILLVDHVNAALAADDAAVLVTLLERTERITDLHDMRLLEPKAAFKAVIRGGAETM